MNEVMKNAADGFRGKAQVFNKMSEYVIDKDVKSYMRGSAEAYLLCAKELEELNNSSI